MNIKNWVFRGFKCTGNAWDLVLISMSLACMHNILSYEVLRSSSAWLLTFFNKENISFLNNRSIKFNYFILLRIEIKIIVVKVWNDIFKFNCHFQQNMLVFSRLPVVGEKQLSPNIKTQNSQIYNFISNTYLYKIYNKTYNPQLSLKIEGHLAKTCA